MQNQATANLTLKRNCRWLAMTVYQYTAHFKYYDAKYEERIKRVLDWHNLDKTSDYYDQCVNISSVSEIGVKLAAILTSLYFDDPTATGWSDLSDYGIGGYMYERAAHAITKGTQLEMTFNCNSATLLTY